MKPTKISGITSLLLVTVFLSNFAHAANECKVQYRYKFKSTINKTLNLNAGQTKSLQQVTSVEWVKNLKNWEASIYITNKGPGASKKWVSLPGQNSIDPPIGKYPAGVTLYKVKCKASGNSSAGTQKPGSSMQLGDVTTIPTKPSIRPLSSAEKNIAKSVFGNSLNLNMVRVTNTLGLQSRPWTTNTPPIYTINVGVDAYNNLAVNAWSRLLIHELSHVWQGQHGVPFMSNSAYHQVLSAIQNGGSPGKAYQYTPGKQWSKYNSEQQASIIDNWFAGGRKTNSKLYPYIRDNVRPGKPLAQTKFK
ncbi:MAG: hypothetical protein Kow006_30080 [Gammaproteobacteria bacterium]